MKGELREDLLLPEKMMPQEGMQGLNKRRKVKTQRFQRRSESTTRRRHRKRTMMPLRKRKKMNEIRDVIKRGSIGPGTIGHTLLRITLDLQGSRETLYLHAKLLKREKWRSILAFERNNGCEACRCSRVMKATMRTGAYQCQCSGLVDGQR